MTEADLDTRVRTQAFQFLTEQTRVHGEVVPRDLLERGFDFEGRRVPLTGPQGIFKPAALAEMPISITTVPVREGEARPYDDGVGPDGFLRYRYRGTDPGHRDNQGLRLAMGRGVPLIYLYGVTPGRYMPVWPVYIVRDHPAELSFSVAVDAPYMPVLSNFKPDPNSLEARRAYITVVTLSGCISRAFASGSCALTSNSARSAVSATMSYSTRPTSSPMATRKASRSYPTGWPCAHCTTPRSTGTFSESGQTS